MNTSEQINEIAAATAKAQGAMRPAVKDATNPAFKSKYADWASIVESMRAPCAANGLTVWQDVELTEAGVAVTTRIVHTSGQWVEFGPLTVPLGKRDAHGVGSAATYAKRYALCAALGIAADEDDDGNAAAQGAQTAKHAPAFDMLGYQKWINTLGQTAKEAGYEALVADVNEGRAEFREQLRADKQVWAKLKAGAKPEAVTA